MLDRFPMMMIPTIQKEIKHFVTCCDNNYLELNVKKAQEMIVDFRKDRAVFDDILIKSEVVKRADSYKYLGITIDDNLTWEVHFDSIVKKRHLYCLRKLRSLRFTQRS